MQQKPKKADMKKTFIIFLHLGYWTIYLLLLALVFALITIQVKKNSNYPIYFPLIILFFLPNLLAFYSSYFYLFPKFLKTKKIVPLFIIGTIFCLISAAFCGLLSTYFYGFDQRIFIETNTFIIFIINMSVIAAIHAVIALIIRGFITWFDEIKLKEELANKNYEIELSLIKSQLNPHFLFNTINNIDVLISKDSAKASEYLNKLSGILRYMLYETKAEKISLVEELNYIEKYLELQKIRTTNPNYVNFEVIGKANNLQIAPMIFFPFIENAFKHTENNKNSNSINIKISISENAINFDCTNTYQPKLNKQQDFGGLGNELIKKRLEMLYSKNHLLEIVDNNSVYKIKLTLYEN